MRRRKDRNINPARRILRDPHSGRWLDARFLRACGHFAHGTAPHSTTGHHGTGEGPCTAPQDGSQG